MTGEAGEILLRRDDDFHSPRRPAGHGAPLDPPGLRTGGRRQSRACLPRLLPARSRPRPSPTLSGRRRPSRLRSGWSSPRLPRRPGRACACWRTGGNAIDAAVAAAFTQTASDPGGSGLGGQTWMVIRLASGEERAVFCPARAPLRIDRAKLKAAQQGSELWGPMSAAVPTTVATLAHALRRYGTMSPAEVLAPGDRGGGVGLPDPVVRALLPRRLHAAPLRVRGPVPRLPDRPDRRLRNPRRGPDRDVREASRASPTRSGDSPTPGSPTSTPGRSPPGSTRTSGPPAASSRDRTSCAFPRASSTRPPFGGPIEA